MKTKVEGTQIRHCLINKERKRFERNIVERKYAKEIQYV